MHTLVHPQVEATLLNNPPTPVIEYTLIPIDTSNCQHPTLSKWCHIRLCVVQTNVCLGCWLMSHEWAPMGDVPCMCVYQRRGWAPFKQKDNLHTKTQCLTDLNLRRYFSLFPRLHLSHIIILLPVLYAGKWSRTDTSCISNQVPGTYGFNNYDLP